MGVLLLRNRNVPLKIWKLVDEQIGRLRRRRSHHGDPVSFVACDDARAMLLMALMRKAACINLKRGSGDIPEILHTIKSRCT